MGKELLPTRHAGPPGPELCHGQGWLEVAPTLPGSSAEIPPPDRHSWVQACRSSPGRFRARLASVRGRQGPSFTAEASKLSLVEEMRKAGLQRVSYTWRLP